MINKNQLLKTIVIIFLATSIACIPISNASAADINNQQKAVSTISNVVGIDVSKYNLVTTEDAQDLYKDNLPRENIRTLLNTTGSNVKVLCSFIGGSLEKIYVCSKEGAPYMNTVANSDLAMAKNFLNKYQTQSKSQICSNLNALLSKIDATKNVSTTIGNIKLNITVLEKDTTFRWTYITNGIEAPNKAVILRYTDGFLNYFIDDWDLYPIGNTTVNLSEKDAIEIAIERAKNYSPDSTEIGTIGGIEFNVTNGMVVEKYLAPAIYAGVNVTRSDNPLELYPIYDVWVSLDKFYPGNVYGFNVYIWADTKDVYYINQRTTTVDPPADLIAIATNSTYIVDSEKINSSTTQNTGDSTILILVSASAVTMLIAVSCCFNLRKSSLPSLPKTRILKFSGTLLCILICTPLLITALAQPVSGTNVGGSVVWGSESTGARNPPSTGESWRKSNSEVTWQRQTSSYIDWLFNRNGYVSANNQGSNNTGSGREAILSKIQNLEQNYPRYAVVDFDHGVGISINNIFHYMFEDNTGTRVGTAYDNSVAASGNTVFDYNVYGNTTGKAFFAFINTCMSADYSNAYSAIPSTDTYSSYTQGTLPDGSARGMPYAWTHRYVGSQMSSDGYGSGKDSGNNCYIGFNYGSAALDQTILNSDYHYYYWIYHFFYYALSNDYSIHTALDLASQDAFYYSPNFDGSPLNTGFTAIWPMYIQGQWRDSWQGTNFTMANCHMKIYGNSDLKLYQPLITLVASLGLSPTFTINGQSYSPGNYRLISGTYSVTVNDIPGRRFTSLTYNGVSYTSRPASIPLTQNGALLATYIY